MPQAISESPRRPRAAMEARLSSDTVGSGGRSSGRPPDTSCLPPESRPPPVLGGAGVAAWQETSASSAGKVSRAQLTRPSQKYLQRIHCSVVGAAEPLFCHGPGVEVSHEDRDVSRLTCTLAVTTSSLHPLPAVRRDDQ